MTKSRRVKTSLAAGAPFGLEAIDQIDGDEESAA
jgi:hypothetical protein